MTAYPLTIATSARRRTLAIQVREGQVIVRRPRGVSDNEVHRLLNQKAGWIHAKLQLQAERMAVQQARSLDTGAPFYWLGEPYYLQVQTGDLPGVERAAGRITVKVSARARRPQAVLVREALHHWLATQALEWFSGRARQLAHAQGWRVQDVKVRVTKSKWGHCTSAGVLQFNPLIMQAPLWVVEYLLVHEVCHLKQPNHSRAFWAQVEFFCPRYRDARRWLRQQGHSLFF